MLTRRHLLRSSALASTASILGSQVISAQTAAPAAAAPSIFTLPSLGYAPDALEPHIDAQTMTIHHGKHHKTYVDKLNEALAKLPTKPKGTQAELEGWLKALDAVPDDIRTAVRNHGGGHYNHTLFWESLAGKPGALKGPLLAAIESRFKTSDAFLAEMQDKGLKVFGSGWVWLCYEPKTKGVVITTTPNQDTPLATGHDPLIGVDVWEHAYYLKYQNKRADYLKAILNVLNWDVAAARLEKAVKASA